VEDAPWMTYKDNVLTIDYDHLREMVVKDFIDYYKRNKFKSSARKRAEERLSTQLQVKYKLNNKATRKGSPKKKTLILRLEKLQMNHLADQLELLRAEKYIKQSRLTNAESILDKIDESLKS
jgi:ABC-type sugar transport system ATPase subunit